MDMNKNVAQWSVTNKWKFTICETTTGTKFSGSFTFQPEFFFDPYILQKHCIVCNIGCWGQEPILVTNTMGPQIVWILRPQGIVLSGNWFNTKIAIYEFGTSMGLRYPRTNSAFAERTKTVFLNSSLWLMPLWLWPKCDDLLHILVWITRKKIFQGWDI